MNDTDKHLHLFHMVEDGLPDISCMVLVVYQEFGFHGNYFEVIRYNHLSQEFIEGHKDYKGFHVLGWMNFDELTTKRRALDLCHASYAEGHDRRPYDKFINRNENTL